jgi:hypothetical protein
MKHTIHFLITVLFISVLFGNAHTGEKTSLIFLPGEELRYSVKWKFIRLGTITITRLDDGSDENTLRISMIVESNPSLPFVDIREYNESLIDARTLMTIEYYGDFRNKKERKESRHIYDRKKEAIYHYEWDSNTGELLLEDTVYNVSGFVNGPSLFSFTRARSCSDTTIDVPTFVRGSVAYTRLDFTYGVREISISAWPYPVRVRKYDGVAEWEGGTSQGLSGEFTGWISDDFAAVPVRAEMKVLLGSIRIELESWDRPDWTPSTSRRLAGRK